MNTQVIREMIGYRWSRDYALLVVLMREGSLICRADYKAGDSVMRDIAHTICKKYEDGSSDYTVGARGICYASGNEAEFMKDCEAVNLEFINPSPSPPLERIVQMQADYIRLRAEFDEYKRVKPWTHFDNPG